MIEASRLLAPAFSLRQALRRETASLHAAVEARFDGLNLGDAGDYGVFLARHAVCILPLEAALDAAGIETLLSDWPRRRRGAALAGDLAELGLPELGLPEPEERPVRIAPGAEALGAAYVLEGSRLGAAMLLRSVAADLPTAFLRHGQQERLWQSFLPHLDGMGSGDLAGALLGARRAFGLFLPGTAP